MIPVLLTRIKTSDGITLEGVVVPPKKKGKIALIWLHGLTSRFSSGQPLMKELSSSCTKNQIAYFKFNTRGHDIVSRGPKQKPIGGAFEKFEECVRDIDTVIRLAKKLGYKKIILAGAISDMSAWKTGDAKKMSRAIRIAKQTKNKDALLPQEYGIYSAARYLSLFEAGNAEDVFPYHNPKAN